MDAETLGTEVKKAIEEALYRTRDNRETVVTVIVLRQSQFPQEDSREPEGVAENLQFDRSWKKRFIEWRKAGRTVTEAAELAGVSKRHACRCRLSDREFGKAWWRASIEKVKSEMSR